MGQMTTGIMVGIIEPDGMDLYGAGVISKWEKACGKEIKALEKSGTLAIYERAASRFVPDMEGCANVSLCGFWIAVGASGKGGVADMPAALDMLAIESIEPYATAIVTARERWQRFAAFAWEHTSVALPPARLLLADTEVA